MPRAENAPSIPEEIWERHASQITQLYITQRMPLHVIMASMKLEHGFSPSKRQYTKQFEIWGLRKNKPRKHEESVFTDATSYSESLSELAGNSAISTASPRNGNEATESSTVTEIRSKQPLALRKNENTSTMEIVHLMEETIPSSRRRFGKVFSTYDQKLMDGDVYLCSKFAFPQAHDVAMTDASDIITEERSDPSSSDGSPSFPQDSSSPYTCSESSLQNTETGREEQRSSDESREHIAIETDEMELGITPPETLTCIDALYRQEELRPTGQMKTATPWATYNKSRLHLDKSSAKVSPSASRPVLKVSPLALLQTLEFDGVLRDCYTLSDIEQVDRLGELFACAGSHEDAFLLFHLSLQQFLMSYQPFSPVCHAIALRDTIGLAKNSTTPANSTKLAQAMSNAISVKQDFLSTISAQGCLVRSHLGGMFKSKQGLSLMRDPCRLALDDYQDLHVDTFSPVYRAVLVENLLIAIKDKPLGVDEKSVQVSDLTRQQFMVPAGWVYNKISKALLDIFIWCNVVLADQDFFRIFQHAHKDLWVRAPSPADLAEFESVVLFCYLWKRWQGELYQSSTKLNYHTATDAALSTIWKLYDITPVETLAFVASITLHTNSSGDSGELPLEKSSLATRALGSVQQVERSRPLRSPQSLLENHVSLLSKKGKRFSTDSYSFLVRKFVREFVEDHFDLHLSCSISSTHTVRPAVRNSVAPSLGRTIMSTPRSSWSDWKSFTSLNRRISAAIRDSVEKDSVAISRRWSHLRWSQNSWRKSGVSFFSNAPSSQDVIMEDAL